MTLLVMIFWILAGATLQVVIPAWQHMGQPAFPFLLAGVLYVAVNKKPIYFVLTALLSGLLEDSLSLVPLGYSACAFLVAGWLAWRLRHDFHMRRAHMVMGLGAICAAASTGTLALLLRLQGSVMLSRNECLLRMAGAAVLAAVLAPVWFWLIRGMERLLGTWEDRA